ncbi:MAG TPA: hypothetical protein VMU35_03580 [Methylomirabilota bacterium]|nr:hypothetical protein [Methylomirabilota bacterium]
MRFDLSKLKAVYSRIMKFDKRVRFAALVDSEGRILDGGMREGVQPIEPLEKTPHLIARLISVRKVEALTEFLGKQEYSILVHDELLAVIFRSKRKFVLVTADRKLPLNKVLGLRKLAMVWEQD